MCRLARPLLLPWFPSLHKCPVSSGRGVLAIVFGGVVLSAARHRIHSRFGDSRLRSNRLNGGYGIGPAPFVLPQVGHQLVRRQVRARHEGHTVVGRRAARVAGLVGVAAVVGRARAQRPNACGGLVDEATPGPRAAFGRDRLVHRARDRPEPQVVDHSRRPCVRVAGVGAGGVPDIQQGCAHGVVCFVVVQKGREPQGPAKRCSRCSSSRSSRCSS